MWHNTDFEKNVIFRTDIERRETLTKLSPSISQPDNENARLRVYKTTTVVTWPVAESSLLLNPMPRKKKILLPPITLKRTVWPLQHNTNDWYAPCNRRIHQFTDTFFGIPKCNRQPRSEKLGNAGLGIEWVPVCNGNIRGSKFKG